MLHKTISLAVVIALASCSTIIAAAESKRPNIVLIMCDDMGFSDIGCYGGEIDTPNIDRLANGGMRFRTFYNNAKCEHTRSSLLSGQWWHRVGASARVTYKTPTFGERLREEGYRTLMTGKWHAGQTPFMRGFDRYYGLTDGCCNFWNPGHAREGEPEPAKKKVRRWAIDGEQFTPFTPDSKDFYTTDAFTDYAIKFLDQYKDEEKPFLLYIGYTAPHYPLHASREDVAKYRGKYKAIGWDKLREQRFARQQELGVLPPNAKLSPRDTGLPSWESIPAADRDWWDLRMAAYAAMIDRMDRNIGRLLKTLDDNGDSDNTLIFFLSDNGACEDSADRSTVKGSMPWEVTSYLTQGRPWANASNTPYRKYKTTDYEGGTRTPMIAYWPAVIKPGSFTDHVGHLVDFAPTMLDVAESKTLKKAATELAGHSLISTFKGNNIERPWPLYWQFGASNAIRDRDWKLIKHGKGGWELYNIAEDPTELNNLAATETERVAQLTQAWEKWWADKGTQGQRKK
ncbi:MAG: arylsulfatase A-like enzyme [Pirellulaceae bacterium]|jgi:arylsulfatase A-like enzyme